MDEDPAVIQELTQEFPVVLEMDVRWGDMDAFNHVNNVSYVRYFESARVAYFEALKLVELYGNDGLGVILAETSCRYKFPLTYPDRISVAARSLDFGKDRFRQEYLVVSQMHGRVAATGDGTIVAFDFRKHVKSPLPARLHKHIEALEARALVNR